MKVCRMNPPRGQGQRVCSCGGHRVSAGSGVRLLAECPAHIQCRPGERPARDDPDTGWVEGGPSASQEEAVCKAWSVRLQKAPRRAISPPGPLSSAHWHQAHCQAGKSVSLLKTPRKRLGPGGDAPVAVMARLRGSCPFGLPGCLRCRQWVCYQLLPTTDQASRLSSQPCY